ncbi:hypothetical protein ACEWY4_026441 [Coilia grayii]|uniref:ZP domain-containing protein n=1 Tax=Coilia grayii TaxID=363190 RepID=A0ABD1IXW9_9TELE
MEVRCLAESMQVALERAGKVEQHKEHLRLSDPNCTLRSNATHLLANVSLSGCGTQVDDDGTYLVFWNMIFSFNDSRLVRVSESEVAIEFSCRYSKQGELAFGHIGQRPPNAFTQGGSGTFSFRLDFFQSRAFGRHKTAAAYPLELDLGEPMYLQIAPTTLLPHTLLFVESCWAAPSANPHDTHTYSIIRHGCTVDQTVEIYANSNASKVQFAMKAFKFMGNYDQVFITCSVILCQASAPQSRCSQGCMRTLQLDKRETHDQTARNATPDHKGALHAWHSGDRLTKRDTSLQTYSHFVSQGPLRLRRQTDSTVFELNQHVVLSIGCLLAVLGVACGVKMYRSHRRSSSRIAPLKIAKEEETREGATGKHASVHDISKEKHASV